MLTCSKAERVLVESCYPWSFKAQVVWVVITDGEIATGDNLLTVDGDNLQIAVGDSHQIAAGDSLRIQDGEINHRIATGANLQIADGVLKIQDGINLLLTVDGDNLPIAAGASLQILDGETSRVAQLPS